MIAAAGAVPLLLTLLGVGRHRCRPRALAKLAKNNKGIQARSPGGIAPLLSLLNGLDVEAQAEAAAALSEMARDNVETQSAIAKAGASGRSSPSSLRAPVPRSRRYGRSTARPPQS